MITTLMDGTKVDDRFTIFVKPTEKILSQRHLESLNKLAEIQQWGLRNPTKFAKRFIGVDLMDNQEYVLMNSWTKTYALWVCTRNWGKSLIIALYHMLRGLLIPYCRGYILSGTAAQSIETFEVIYRLAMGEITTFTGLEKDIFRNEVVRSQASSDGFIRNPAGFTYRLFNGSFVKTLNSNIQNMRGKRADLVTFDESGFLSGETFQVIEPYTAQNKDFKTGDDIDITLLPHELPSQLLYASSASDVDTPFYDKFKSYSKMMIAGCPEYFVADLNCDVIIKPLMHGVFMPTGLIDQTKVDTAMAEDKEKALREYYCHFTREGGVGQIIKRADIVRNSSTYAPLMANDGNRKFIICYDPARSADNSFILISELIDTPDRGLIVRLVNGVNLIDVNRKKRTPMTTPEQIEHLKKLILAYNGSASDYDNIVFLGIDAGAGGGGVTIADLLMPDWHETGHEGDPHYKHHGLIDREYSSDYIKTFPNALDKLRLLSPKKYKSDMYEATIQMVTQGLVEFPAEYSGYGYLTLLKVDESAMKKIEAKIEREAKEKNYTPEKKAARLQEEIENSNSAKTERYALTDDEEIALTQLDALKTELVNIVRKKRDGDKDSFDLSPEKAKVLHDDRAYTFAMTCWILSELRRQENIKVRSAPKADPTQIFTFRQPKRTSSIV